VHCSTGPQQDVDDEYCACRVKAVGGGYPILGAPHFFWKGAPRGVNPALRHGSLYALNQAICYYVILARAAVRTAQIFCMEDCMQTAADEAGNEGDASFNLRTVKHHQLTSQRPPHPSPPSPAASLHQQPTQPDCCLLCYRRQVTGTITAVTKSTILSSRLAGLGRPACSGNRLQSRI